MPVPEGLQSKVGLLLRNVHCCLPSSRSPHAINLSEAAGLLTGEVGWHEAVLGPLQPSSHPRVRSSSQDDHRDSVFGTCSVHTCPLKSQGSPL